MQKKSPLGKFAASVAVAVAIPALFVFVTIHHAHEAHHAQLPRSSAGVPQPKAATRELRLDEVRQASARVRGQSGPDRAGRSLPFAR